MYGGTLEVYIDRNFATALLTFGALYGRLIRHMLLAAMHPWS